VSENDLTSHLTYNSHFRDESLPPQINAQPSQTLDWDCSMVLCYCSPLCCLVRDMR